MYVCVISLHLTITNLVKNHSIFSFQGKKRAKTSGKARREGHWQAGKVKGFNGGKLNM